MWYGRVLFLSVVGALTLASAQGAAAGPTAHNSSGCCRNVLFMSGFCAMENFNASETWTSVQETFGSSDFFDVTVVNIKEEHASGGSVQAFLNGLLSIPSPLAVIHPGCFGDDNAVLADVSKVFNTTIISFAFSSTSRVAIHSNYVSMVPNATHLGRAVAAALKFYGWRTAHVFSEDSLAFGSIWEVVAETMKSHDRNISVTQTLLLSGKENVIQFPTDNKILVLNTYPRLAREIICQALSESSFSMFVWITYEWHDSDWWRDSRSSCHDHVMEEALEQAIVVSHHAFVEDEPEASYALRNIYEKYAYDAMLAVETILSGKEDNSTSDLQYYFNKVYLNGTSGHVSFKDGIRELEVASVKVYRNNELVRIGTVNASGNFMYINNESNDTVWQNGMIPWDGIPVKRINSPLLPLMAICYFYSSLGIVFSFVCLIFNIVFRNKKLIQLSSPNLNYVIIAGAIVMQCSSYTFFHMPDISDGLLAALCNLRLILLAVGFTLCYMPINAKMWRVYHICRKPNPSMKKLLIKDWHLILLVLAILAVEVVALAILMAINSTRYSVREIPDKEHPGLHDLGHITVLFYVRRCYTDKEIIFIPLFIGTKLFVQFIGVFLAFSIRNIKIKGLNDSREVSAILYVTTAMTAVMAIIIFIFGDYINIDGAAYGFGATTGACCVLGLTFIPKMVSLYRDPRGERIFVNNNTQGVTETMNDQKMVINAYQKRIKELEWQLSENKISVVDITTTNSISDGGKESPV